MMNEAEVAEFIASYERLTRWMLEERPEKVGVTVSLLESHAVGSVVLR